MLFPLIMGIIFINLNIFINLFYLYHLVLKFLNLAIFNLIYIVYNRLYHQRQKYQVIIDWGH